jgi:hypothetical protein
MAWEAIGFTDGSWRYTFGGKTHGFRYGVIMSGSICHFL